MLSRPDRQFDNRRIAEGSPPLVSAAVPERALHEIQDPLYGLLIPVESRQYFLNLPVVVESFTAALRLRTGPNLLRCNRRCHGAQVSSDLAPKNLLDL